MEAQDAAYESQNIPAPPEFSEVFSHFYRAENKTAQAVHKTLLPTYQTILVFSFGTDVLLHSRTDSTIAVSRCLLLSPIRRSFNYTMPPAAELLVANFKDDAFFRFFGQAMLWGNQPVQPDALAGEDCFNRLWHLLKAMDKAGRVDYILRFCKPYLKDRSNALQQIAAASAASSLLNPVKVVAGNTGRSERLVQQHFKKYLGYSAKEIARYQRFLQAVEITQNYAAANTRADWFEVIEQCGYYDQSQLIHDFKYYMNITPAQFLKLQEDICIVGQP